MKPEAVKIGGRYRHAREDRWPGVHIAKEVRGGNVLTEAGYQFYAMNLEPAEAVPVSGAPEPEYTGGSSSYYEVAVEYPTTAGRAPYHAECNDIIEALGMNYAEGNAFKALWRSAAARTLGKHKKGNTALYDAEKVEFFGKRLVEQHKERKT